MRLVLDLIPAFVPEPRNGTLSYQETMDDPVPSYAFYGGDLGTRLVALATYSQWIRTTVGID
jgi:hypothetical protein